MQVPLLTSAREMYVPPVSHPMPFASFGVIGIDNVAEPFSYETIAIFISLKNGFASLPSSFIAEI